MSSEAMHEFLQTVEAEVQSRPTPTEFEMAYQARVAIDRIRFAIKHTEQFGPRTDQMRETGLQLRDFKEQHRQRYRERQPRGHLPPQHSAAVLADREGKREKHDHSGGRLNRLHVFP